MSSQTVPECSCSASKFIGGRWVSMAQVTVGETTGVGVVHDANACCRCGHALTAEGKAVDVVPAVTGEAVRNMRIIGALQAASNPNCPSEQIEYVMSLRLPHLLERVGAGGSVESPGDAARALLAALSQATGLAAAEMVAGWFAYSVLDEATGESLHKGAVCPAFIEHVCPGKCERPCAQMFLSAAIAAVGAPIPDQADGPSDSGLGKVMRERDTYRTALMHAGGYLWQECTRLLDGSDDEPFDEDLSGEQNWFLKFLRDAINDKRGWASGFLGRDMLVKTRAILAARQPEPTGEGGCPYCGGDDCNCDQRTEEEDDEQHKPGCCEYCHEPLLDDLEYVVGMCMKCQSEIGQYEGKPEESDHASE